MNFKRYHESHNLLNIYKEGFALDASGNENENADFNIYQAMVNVDELQYILTGTAPVDRNIRVHEYVNNTWISQLVVDLGSQLPFRLTKSLNANRLLISINKNNSNMMLAVGSTVLPYEPYGHIWSDSHYIRVNGAWQSVASAHEMNALLADNPLCGISTYKDTLDFATGDCTRYIKKVTFDGSEGWRLAAPGLFVLSAMISDYYRVPNVDIAICSHYPTQSNVEYQSQINEGYATFYARESNAYRDFYISDTTMGTETDFKAFLATEYSAGRPVTIWYILDNPTTETITVPTGLSGTEEGYLNQSGTPTPTNPIYPTANNVELWQ